MDDSVYRYSRPRIVYNNQKVDIKSPLPGWADALYASLYGCSTGVITYGLTPEELRLAARRQVYAVNPFEARSKGGYSILTQYRVPHCPIEEHVESSELLSELSKRELPYATRADLYPNASEGWDPIYFDSALVEAKYHDSKRKARDAFSEYSGTSLQEYHDAVYKKLRQIVNNPDDALEKLNSLLRDKEFNYDEALPAPPSDHGLEEDDDYIEGMLDDVDMSQFQDF